MEEIHLRGTDQGIERLIDQLGEIFLGKGLAFDHRFERIADDQFEDDIGTLLVLRKFVD